MDDGPGCMMGRAGLWVADSDANSIVTVFRWMIKWAADSEWNSMTTGLPGQMDHRRGLGWDWDDLWMIEHNRRTSNSS